MSTLLDVISKALQTQTGEGSGVDSIAAKVGESPQATQNAINQALPLLIGALSKQNNAGSGWAMLSSFLDKNHDGSVWDDLIGMALGTSKTQSTGNVGQQNAAALEQILGVHKSAVQQQVEQTSGLSSSSVAKLLPLLAPLVIGALAKVQKSQSLDEQSLSKMLEVERNSVAKSAPQSADFLTSMLDKDGDGSVLDDVAQAGAGMLGKLLGGR